MFLGEGFILALQELIILPASCVKVRYSSTSALGLHTLDDHKLNALAIIAMAAAVPEPIARAPFHNTHRLEVFYFS
jgi:hypothetical protein